MIQKAKADDARDDPALKNKLVGLEKEAQGIDKELSDIEKQEKDVLK
jgi:hypothetical protein